ncbi:MAG: ECF transporter S component [Prevotellaceae bacterium]|jgi:hypothetical protein|nr:ECF transporter S component [Prevotellaceae bacterium]
MKTSVKLYSMSLKEVHTYLFVLLFVVGNILLPQLCHFVPGGGHVWLPIYFFTLIAAYKYGLYVGLLTALLSAIVNSFLFGMPVFAILPVILSKSILLVGVAAYAVHRLKRVSFMAILAVIVVYQLLGAAIEGVIMRDFALAVQHIRIAVPGMLVQLCGGYLILKSMSRI